MNNDDKTKLIHDFANAAGILRCIAISATKFAGELHNPNIQPDEKHTAAFIERMDAMQIEIDNMQHIFDTLIEE